MREIYTIKRITSCRPELLTLPYSHTHTHKGCQRSPTKLVYRRLHRSGREQVKRLLFGRRGGGGGGETSFFFHLRRNEWSSYWTLHRCSPRARVCPSYLVFFINNFFYYCYYFFPFRNGPARDGYYLRRRTHVTVETPAGVRFPLSAPPLRTIGRFQSRTAVRPEWNVRFDPVNRQKNRPATTFYFKRTRISVNRCHRVRNLSSFDYRRIGRCTASRYPKYSK